MEQRPPALRPLRAILELADVRRPAQAGGRGIPAPDHGLEAGPGCQPGAERVENAGENQDLLDLDQIAEPLGRSHRLTPA